MPKRTRSTTSGSQSSPPQVRAHSCSLFRLALAAKARPHWHNHSRSDVRPEFGRMFPGASAGADHPKSATSLAKYLTDLLTQETEPARPRQLPDVASRACD